MAICSVCNKKKISGQNVSHSQRKTKKRFKPNLQKVNGVFLCTRCLRTSAKSIKK